MNLDELRENIDDIDEKLLTLLLERMDISQQVAEYKIKNSLPVLNAAREEEILNIIASKSGSKADGMKAIFSTIMDVSRGAQHTIMNGGNELRKKINDAFMHENVHSKLPIACAGVEGAYASEAATKMFHESKLSFYTSFKDVFLAVEKGDADFGVVPVENSTAGSVHETYDLIMKYRFFVVRGYDLPIKHCLCAKKGTKLCDIKKIFSHSQGIAQCAQFISKIDAQAINYSNTAAAAKYVSTMEENNCAAICSANAAKEYGLEILNDSIQSSDTNTTRFLVFSKKLQIEKDADKISLILTLPHSTGSLYKLLGRFSMCGLNLTKLESRPNTQSNFSYDFYLDFTGNISNPSTLDLICALSSELPSFNFLGNFHEYQE